MLDPLSGLVILGVAAAGAISGSKIAADRRASERRRRNLSQTWADEQQRLHRARIELHKNINDAGRDIRRIGFGRRD